MHYKYPLLFIIKQRDGTSTHLYTVQGGKRHDPAGALATFYTELLSLVK